MPIHVFPPQAGFSAFKTDSSSFYGVHRAVEGSKQQANVLVSDTRRRFMSSEPSDMLPCYVLLYIFRMKYVQSLDMAYLL